MTGEPFAVRTPAGPRWTGRVELIPSKLDEPLRWRKPQRVFVNSMSDLFHESLSFKDISRVYGVMARAHWHTFQVLTKRPERRAEFFREGDRLDQCLGAAFGIGPSWRHAPSPPGDFAWPLPNVWEGTSIENQATADERIPLLLQTPAAKRFVSYEPALGPIDFDPWVTPCGCTTVVEHRRLDWVIVGGESGPGARPFDLAWARSTIRQCREAGVACFMKQWGAHPFDSEDRANAHVASRKDRKGGNPSEWPEDLMVREFPA